ncbi:hypothetical protein QF002_001562 [Paraburkholderia youngii]
METANNPAQSENKVAVIGGAMCMYNQGKAR